MLAPSGYQPQQVDEMEIWQVAVLVGADHPMAKRSSLSGRDKLVAEAIERRKALNPPSNTSKAETSGPNQGSVVFGFTGPDAQRRNL